MNLRVLFVGDVFADAGRKIIATELEGIRGEMDIDLCVANGENASSKGMGISRSAAADLFRAGVDVLTLGNHTWKNREVLTLFEEEERLIRPANYPTNNPGNGSVIVETDRGNVGIINVAGRVYMDSADCPFRAAEREIAKLRRQTAVILIDFHGEATSEKYAFAYFVDGKVSCVVGTHTHVQTADERIMPEGTAFITDVGMTGPADGIIGVDREIIIKKFLTQIPSRFEPAKGDVQLCAVVVEIDESTGRAVSIERLKRVVREP